MGNHKMLIAGKIIYWAYSGHNGTMSYKLNPINQNEPQQPKRHACAVNRHNEDRLTKMF